jgi:hypothetical protein
LSNASHRFLLYVSIVCASLIAQAQSRIAIPSYQDPGSSQWNAWIAPGRSSVGIMIVNEDNGDDLTYYPAVNAGIQAARKKGVFVVGYVYTAYGLRDLATVESDIEGVYKNYSVDGIFFDEAPTDCNAASITGASTYAYYQQLADYVRSRQAGARLVILNPGTQPANDCWMSLANILVISEEDNLKDYKSGYQDQDWFHRYPPDRFWHIVYNIDKSADFDTVLALSRHRGAGWIYITDGNSSNPYLKPPAYWQLETSTVAGEDVQAPYATFRPRASDENGRPVPARFSVRWSSPRDTAWYVFLDSSVKSHQRYSTTASGLSIFPDYLLKIEKNGTATLAQYSGNGSSFAWTELSSEPTTQSIGKSGVQVDADAAALDGATSLRYQIQANPGGQPSMPEPLSLNNTSYAFDIESH